jgi:molecular chaperone DnaK
MDEILVGIDFGTTNTVISYFSNNKAVVLSDGIFKTIPSKIGKYNDKIYCGNYIPINCQDIIHSFKISIGNEIKFKFNKIDKESYTHEELMIIFFKHIYDIIIKNMKNEKLKIKGVLTVPSNFNDKQREIIKQSFINVNIEIIRIINEPSAAALAYGLNHSSNAEEKILVIDTGGGTMDFTILEKDEMFFEVVHSEGLNDLGGNNFTELIVNDIMRNKNNDEINKNILWNNAQKIKEKLTFLDNYEIKLLNYSLSKTKFENLTNQLIKKVETVLHKIMENYDNLNYIILVGGTSRIPILQDTIKRITNKNPWIHPNLESVVSEGACFYAGIIENKYTNNEDVVLMDVLPLSLGVELVDKSFSIVIPKNTPLPVKRSQKYTTDSPCESSIKIKVYQGERKIANQNILIGEFEFDKVTMGGTPVIEISFRVDLNSIINVTVLDRKSNIEKNIIIKDLPQIDQSKIDELINIATKLSDNDDAELSKLQNIYLIKVHIENSINNLQVNELMSDEDKKEMLNQFAEIEDNLETMTNIQLVETIKLLNEKYGIIGSVGSIGSINIEQTNGTDNNMDDIEKLFIEDKKNELKNRLNLLLVKNPEWEEFVQPVLEQLSYNNTTMEYIDDKLKLLDELEEEGEYKKKDYRQEVNNLCLYLKQEIETGSINMGETKNSLLIDLINEKLGLLSNGNENINWEEEINILNKRCEEIYNL